MEIHWQVYMIRCSDDSLYTGITTDVKRRFTQHASGKGAKYFRGRCPQRIVYLEDGHNRSSASCRELEIKKMAAVDKRRLLGSTTNQLAAG